MGFDYNQNYLDGSGSINYPVSMNFVSAHDSFHYYKVEITWMADDDFLSSHEALLLDSMNIEVYETSFQHSFLLVPSNKDDYSFT